MVTMVVAVVVVMAIVVASNIYVNSSYNMPSTVLSALSIQSSQQIYEVDIIIIAILYMSKLRLREIKY